MFGIENKELSAEGSTDDCGLECIICMSDIRDTVILPCRHLCICNNCADTLRYKVSAHLSEFVLLLFVTLFFSSTTALSVDLLFER